MVFMIAIETLKERATKFAKEFEQTKSEKRNDQDFMRGLLCGIFEISSNRIEWQYPVKENKTTRFIDGFLLNTLLIEMKSTGKDLEEAYQQAVNYVSLIEEKHRPNYILVSDFQILHLYNRQTGEPRFEINLTDLPQHIELFSFLYNFEKIAIEKQERTNREAAEKMADLHDAIKKTGYTGKDLETYLVRLLFCLFADNTGLFGENNQFLNYLINYTKNDGSDLHGALSNLFDTLNLPDESYLIKHPNYQGDKRLKDLPEHLNKFSYINGLLFEKNLRVCHFNETSRNMLIECANLDWSEISPAIFGALFQAIMHFDDEQSTAKTKKRREFGAHYTSEENILKTINPLFMDDLRTEFSRYKNNKKQLIDFHHKLSILAFFDPACGCGNFLIIAYRELRLLELEIIKALRKENLELDVSTLIKCDVDQFYGIDIDESAVQIATVAMWLTDHQMNLKVQQLGQYFKRTPLKKKANIFQGNALKIDWKDIISPDKCSFIMGNPPFIGKKEQSAQQKSDLRLLSNSIKGAGVLDYVTGWYFQAVKYIQENQNIRCAFVSTNSICQGEQVGVLWNYLLAQGIQIYFAHRTFKWSNEGRGIAAVHCVIIGFGLQKPNNYRLFDYGNNIKGTPIEIKATQINPYLVDAPNCCLEKRSNPLSNVPSMNYGSMPIDNGHLILSEEDKNELLRESKNNQLCILEYMGGEEFLNNKKRYCLWLKNTKPEEINKSKFIIDRIKKVKDFRNSSDRETTQKLADYSSLFGEIRQPNQNYLLLPKVSSETRYYMPIGFINPNVIANGSALIIPNATLFHFGILQSVMHMAWMRTVCGRMKSDYQYSASIVYNNFPFPNPTEKQLKNIEEKVQAILDARAEHKTSTLADLYNPLIMPANLVQAHKALDKAVDAAYNYKGSKEDSARVAFLFELYQKVTSPLIKENADIKPKSKRRVKT